ncbi:hypothetical protein [Acidovorax sp. sic0104]|uniref:hypothetical protein n=1 Tax=Acidovorax sp. sic0104 TaxID=2854784 RepID=UPI0030D74E2A
MSKPVPSPALPRCLAVVCGSVAWVLAVAGNAHALGTDMPYSAFATAPDVDWLQVCGEWPAPPARDGSQRGTYRIVHASRYAQSFLFVQWLRHDDTDSAQEVKTLGVPALNNDHAAISLSQMRCQATPRGIRLTARAASGHDGSVFRITIDAGHKPGDLRYRSTGR